MENEFRKRSWLTTPIKEDIPIGFLVINASVFHLFCINYLLFFEIYYIYKEQAYLAALRAANRLSQSNTVYKVIRVFSQEYLQAQNKNVLIKSTLQKLFWAQSFTPDHLLIEKQDLIYVFCSTLFKTVRFRNSRTTRANCYIFSCSSGMEGSENVKSNLSFSEESELFLLFFEI